MQPRPIAKISATSKFTRSLKKLPRQIQDKIHERDQIFRRDAFDPRLGTHKLKGKLWDYWSYTIDYQYRVLFKFVNGNEVVYHDIGTHKVYR